ncbi:DUF6745 domain-containing protein [Deinococcus maricopensis]|uniref:DUF6745 domain-containing protein n=1 Tax=Deinococcus maricopensis (strain DSM 21211 / LMG 22137 / NRRL B-23946 / LB-34) TaxID=709986 RepID=E8U869_DEIML|nr:hypothetical protein [Deinococcus maricopensis]ADV67258.1 hypothetical protein Deima_1609 [Deinococcus maricopensis DSM 21211]
MFRITSRPSLTPREPRPAPTAPHAPCTPAQARTLILTGRAPDDLRVDGALDLSGTARLHELPRTLECTHLNVSDCPNLTVFPDVLRAASVNAARTGARELHGDWLVRGPVDLRGHTHLTRLPERLTATSLNVSDCPNLHALPDGTHLSGPIDVAGSGLSGLPRGLRAPLHWRGTPIDARAAFHPDELRAADILHTRNVTRRRVLLDRFGLDRFVREVGGLIMDRDRDAGGERQLIMIPLDNDEPIIAVKVHCPSTGHAYVLRVPPHIRTCRRAAAWLAGFEHERDYRPVQEA